MMLLVVLIGVPMIWLGLRSLHMRPLRRWSAIVARLAVLTLLSMMLAGTALVRETNKATVIGVIDVSGSVRDFVRLPHVPEEGYGDSSLAYLRWWFRKAVADRGPDDRFGLIVFDGTTFAVAAPTAGEYADDQLDIRLVDGTNIEQAIRLAAAMFPPDATRRIILATDGNETTGDAVAAAVEAAGGALASRTRSPADESYAARTPIDVLPLPYQVRREVIVESVDAPPTAPSESTITLRITLSSTDETTGILQVTREGRPVDLNGQRTGTGRRIRLRPGRNVELVEVPLSLSVVHRFEAFFEATTATADTLVGNNRGEAFTVSPGKGSVLIVDNNENPTGGTLENTLRRLAINTQRFPASSLPRDLLSLHKYDLIILNNVPAEQIPPAKQRAIAEYVSKLGGGLVMVGGVDSLGAGGWKGTPLEPILPVKLDLPEQLIIPTAAVAFILDNSSSMFHTVFGTGETQQQIANEGAALAIETLDKTDLVTVITFNNTAREVVPLTKNADPKQISHLVRSIAPSGGTRMYPALAMAHESLRDCEAQVKHVILLSDGRSMPGPFTELAKQMRNDHITVSTIAVGDDADDATLRDIADYGDGKFYRVHQPALLPRIFIKDVRVVRKPLVREIPFKPALLPSGSPLTTGLSTLPTLDGLVLTQAREDETVTLAAVHPDGSPVLAHWNVELGQVAAFTSTADGEWASRWIQGEAYQKVWGQIARVIARPAASGDSELRVEITDGLLHIRLDAADRQGTPLDLLTVPGFVYPPTGDPVRVTLNQTGPGTYEATTRAEDAGNYVVALTPRKGNVRMAPIVGGANRAIGPEYGRLQSNEALLKRISDMTGGRLLALDDPYSAGLYDRSTRAPVYASQPIWMSLMWWCLGLLLLDIGTRRVAWDRYVSKAAAIEFTRRAAESVRSRGHEATATLGALRTRSDQAESQRDSLAQDVDKLKGDGGVMKIPKRQRKGEETPATGKPSARDVLDALRQLQHGPAAPTQPTDSPEQDDEPRDASDTTSSLLEAKRRARARFHHPDDEPPDDST
ncbi:MAG: VWA domain-containing protein [Phycisphaerales bacterium]|nr:VWA domain-containing protein [Phycisphaerales bacterium]